MHCKMCYLINNSHPSFFLHGIMTNLFRSEENDAIFKVKSKSPRFGMTIEESALLDDNFPFEFRMELTILRSGRWREAINTLLSHIRGEFFRLM